jgi:hypothetical protein
LGHLPPGTPGAVYYSQVFWHSFLLVWFYYGTQYRLLLMNLVVPDFKILMPFPAWQLVSLLKSQNITTISQCLTWNIKKFPNYKSTLSLLHFIVILLVEKNLNHNFSL